MIETAGRFANRVRAQAEEVADDRERVELSEPWQRATLCLLIGIIAWVQFPLGSNRPWSWSLLALLIGLTWIVWIPAALTNSRQTKDLARRIILPIILMASVLFWVWFQSVGFSPISLHNSLWTIASKATGQPVIGAVSINPFATQTELMKLCSYISVGWLSYALSSRYERARALLITVFVVGAAYALYGILLSVLNLSQFQLFTGWPSPYGRDVSGGFVAKNSFATFSGISFLAGLELIVAYGRNKVVTSRGWRTFLRTLILYTFSTASGWLIGSLILLGALIASDSRAGMIATCAGLMVIFCLTLAVSAKKGQMKWTLAGGATASVAILSLFLLNGQNLQTRFENLIETAGTQDLRPVMWQVALRALADHPLTGTGLGTYADAYNIYSSSFVPYVVDRAHNDYLEFAMGVGLPAAAIWLMALAIIAGRCAIGAVRRRRHRMFAMTAIGATAIVGFHSIFDFSLQMPAVSVIYAVIMGVGIAQSESSRRSDASYKPSVSRVSGVRDSSETIREKPATKSFRTQSF